MGPRNRLLDGGPDILRKGDKGRPIVKYSDTLPWAVQNGWTDRDTVWVMDSDGPSEACIRCGPDPPCEGAIISEKDLPGHADDSLPWAAQKWLNRSICGLGCGLGWAEGSTSSIVFARLRQLAPATEYDWTVRLRRRCVLMSYYFDHLLLLLFFVLSCISPEV